MRQTDVIALLALIVIVPAALAGAQALGPPTDGRCFAAGATAYRFTTAVNADYTIRVDETAPSADLTVQIVDDPAVADFVLLAETDDANDCRAARTIRVDPHASEPDLIITLRRDAADDRARIYAEGSALRPEDAAALFAVMRKAPKKRIATASR